MTTSSRRRRVLLGGVLALALAAGGCTRGQDDELAPRPTRTVTVTPSPTVSPAAEVPVGRASFEGRVVWAQGSDLHVGDRTLDLAPVRVDRLVATPRGVYVLARGELWSVDLQRAEGAGLPRVERVGLSRDGGSLLVDLAGNRERRAYDVATGRLQPGRAPAPLTRDLQRAGPGEYAVTRAADGSPEVTAADGSTVEVADLPDDLVPEVWPTPSRVAGSATAADGTRSVVSCSLEGAARCTTLGEVVAGEPVRFAVAPLPG